MQEALNILEHSLITYSEDAEIAAENRITAKDEDSKIFYRLEEKRLRKGIKEISKAIEIISNNNETPKQIKGRKKATNKR